MIKRCRKCERELPATLEYFYYHKGGRNGLESQCKACKSKQDKLNAERLKAERDEAMKDWQSSETIPAANCFVCLWLLMCRERVKRGQWVACERPTEDDIRRMAVVEARR